MMIDKPYEVGDKIEVNMIIGTVVGLKIMMMNGWQRTRYNAKFCSI